MRLSAGAITNTNMVGGGMRGEADLMANLIQEASNEAGDVSLRGIPFDDVSSRLEYILNSSAARPTPPINDSGERRLDPQQGGPGSVPTMGRVDPVRQGTPEDVAKDLVRALSASMNTPFVSGLAPARHSPPTSTAAAAAGGQFDSLGRATAKRVASVWRHHAAADGAAGAAGAAGATGVVEAAGVGGAGDMRHDPAMFSTFSDSHDEARRRLERQLKLQGDLTSVTQPTVPHDVRDATQRDARRTHPKSSAGPTRRRDLAKFLDATETMAMCDRELLDAKSLIKQLAVRSERTSRALRENPQASSYSPSSRRPALKSSARMASAAASLHDAAMYDASSPPPKTSGRGARGVFSPQGGVDSPQWRWQSTASLDASVASASASATAAVDMANADMAAAAVNAVAFVASTANDGVPSFGSLRPASGMGMSEWRDRIPSVKAPGGASGGGRSGSFGSPPGSPSEGRSSAMFLSGSLHQGDARGLLGSRRRGSGGGGGDVGDDGDGYDGDNGGDSDGSQLDGVGARSGITTQRELVRRGRADVRNSYGPGNSVNDLVRDREFLRSSRPHAGPAGGTIGGIPPRAIERFALRRTLPAESSELRGKVVDVVSSLRSEIQSLKPTSSGRRDLY